MFSVKNWKGLLAKTKAHILLVRFYNYTRQLHGGVVNIETKETQEKVGLDIYSNLKGIT
jgi:hypothetical protein